MGPVLPTRAAGIKAKIWRSLHEVIGYSKPFGSEYTWL